MTDADKLIEAVAKAIGKAEGCCGGLEGCPIESKLSLTHKVDGVPCECAIYARAALSAIDKSGWAVVPIEPTEDMIHNLYGPYLSASCNTGRKNSYHDMLSARPRITGETE